jgi:hypothetical protein
MSSLPPADASSAATDHIAVRELLSAARDGMHVQSEKSRSRVSSAWGSLPAGYSWQGSGVA